MRTRAIIILLAAIIWYSCFPAYADPVRNICATSDGTDVTITATTETVVATLAACPVPSSQIKALVRCSGIVTTSANSTTYKVRIRRTNVSGTALGDAVAETIKVAAGSTEMYFLEATDQQNADVSGVVYVCTLEFAGADATGTSKWSTIAATLF